MTQISNSAVLNQSKKYENIQIILVISIITAFIGQFYLKPFAIYFRFSLSVTALSLAILYFNYLSSVFISVLVGLTTILLRALINIATLPGILFKDLIKENISSFLFYLSFGVLTYLFNVRGKKDNTIFLFLYLWSCDSISNIVELLTFIHLMQSNFENAIFVIILIGAVRSVLTVAVYKTVVYFLNHYEYKKNKQRYSQRVLFFSNIKIELFFFKKSLLDIEEAMKISFGLYKKLENTQFKGDSLAIARKIHEVKKDYLRICASMEKELDIEYEELPIKISEIFQILNENTNNLISSLNRNIDVTFIYENDFTPKNFYALVSVLNNLIINSIEAIDDDTQNGKIVVIQKIIDSEIFFHISDNGCGIAENDFDYVFEPGFTTKFNPQTGESYTGIGLIHVKHLVEKYYGGRIDLKSITGRTDFYINIPIENIT